MGKDIKVTVPADLVQPLLALIDAGVRATGLQYAQVAVHMVGLMQSEAGAPDEGEK